MNESNYMEIKGKIFIGHGGSKDWEKLRDYLSNELNLEWDELNRDPADWFFMRMKYMQYDGSRFTVDLN